MAAPGIVIECTPRAKRACNSFRRSSIVDVDVDVDDGGGGCASSTSRIDDPHVGLRPLPLIAETSPAFASYHNANMSPPSPVLHGSNTANAADMATLASAALPPRPRNT
jgi:hypothetical protein